MTLGEDFEQATIEIGHPGSAEDKLEERYDSKKEPLERTPEMIKKGEYFASVSPPFLNPEDIDLIANLVVERLKKEDK